MLILRKYANRYLLKYAVTSEKFRRLFERKVKML